MQHKLLILGAALLLVLASFSHLAYAAGAPERIVAIPLTPSVSAEAAAAWNTLGLTEKSSIPQLNAHVLSLPSGVSADSAIAKLASTGLFQDVEKDAILTPAMIPNDTDYPQQWNLSGYGFPKAWNLSLGAGVTVAILDTGVDCNLQEFSGQCVSGWNVVDNNGTTADDVGHGTAVASIAGAATNNGMDIAAGAPASKIMPVKINQAGQGTATVSAIAAGIVWAADHGAKVANLSFANSQAPGQVIMAAAYYLRQDGGILFQSAGNDGIKIIWPNVSVIDTIGGTSQSKQIVYNYGPSVDLMAPGFSVPCLSTDGSVTLCFGTSASSPLAASVAALMLAKNPALLPWQVENIMFANATDKGKDGYDNKWAWGILNANGAVVNAFADPGPDITPPDAPFINSWGQFGNTVQLTWTQGFDNTGPVASYNVYRDGNKIGKTTGLQFTDSNPVHGANNSYWVKSVDDVKLVSAQSNTANQFVQ